MNTDPNLPEIPDPLDALLREADVPIPDAGFTTRVMVTLPPRRRFGGLRTILLTASLLAGVVVLLWHGPAVGAALAVLFQHHWPESSAGWWPLLAVVVAIASLVWLLMSLALEEET